MNEPTTEPGGQPPFQEQLTAYLDGELDSTTSLEIERRLAAEPGVQQTLKQFQQTWDLLDQLPRAEIDARFTRSTVEMIAVAAEADAGGERSPAAGRWRFMRQAAGLLAAAAAGFLMVRLLWPEPNGPLLRDLPVLENLEAYRQTPDLEFLKQLNKSGLFAEEPSNE
jgi:hypothetical protein